MDDKDKINLDWFRFSASLRRPDPVLVSNEEIAELQVSLGRLLSHGTQQDIDVCSKLLSETIVSSTRARDFGKYVVSLLPQEEYGDQQPAVAKDAAKKGLKRTLRIFYLIHAFLHRVKAYALPDRFATVSGSLRAALLDMGGAVGRAGAIINSSYKGQKEYNKVLGIWEKYDFFEKKFILEIRAEEAKSMKEARTGQQPINGNPYHVPEPRNPNSARVHGKPGTPWHDLPAACLVQNLNPGDTSPIKVADIKPITFGPPDEKVTQAVKDFVQYLKDTKQNRIKSRGVEDTGKSENDSYRVTKLRPTDSMVALGKKWTVDPKNGRLEGTPLDDDYWGMGPRMEN